MPVRPGKACRQSHCPNIARLAEHRGYCEQHKDKAGWGLNESLNGNRHQRGYGRDWDKLRAVVLTIDKHLCRQHKAQGIIKPATHVDHIISKAQGGTNALSNLQSLCVDCHNAKTARER
jgi:5-methylcytosine-specific restriction enzyme A